ncbi:hypothetical protein [Streptomyces sp. ISID311]|uniref:hypothetical protein n=1 Tax=Streptomyces sp. ISID311 TaxID=2601673 RepID=UPI0011BD3157|nr:hypothetical protein [Streptomyces sp. ISID311]TXC99088.1 hypothetical protein FS847_06830 [Streptomyces sp. ISID311]
MNPPLPHPAKPDYTSVFMEPAYPGGEPYKRPEDEDEDEGESSPVGSPGRSGSDPADERKAGPARRTGHRPA